MPAPPPDGSPLVAPTATERRLTPRGRDRKRQLMDAAARLFAEGGYHPTSVAEIVTRLGVGKGVFYWYFASKEELFLAILKETQQNLRRAQYAAIGLEPDPLRRIETGIEASMRWLDENRHLTKLVAFAATDERFAPALRRGAKIAAADVERHLRDAIDERRIPDADPSVLALAILGVTDSLARVMLYERGDDPARVAEAAIAFCREGLAATASLARA